jgi:hypothetical protein
MYSGLGHLLAFMCELTVVAARGIEGAGLVALTAILSSAYLVSVGLVRAWHEHPETYAPWDARPQTQPMVYAEARAREE